MAALSAAVGAPLLILVASTQAAAAVPAAPDVVIIFVDGYASSETLNSIYGFDNSDFETRLQKLGFDVSPNAVASYSMTYASIASVLEMDYVVGSGHIPDAVLRPQLYRRMQGDNAFIRRAKANGYHYIHIESGWGGTRCGPEVQQCVRAPFLEETVWNFIQRTALAPLMQVWIGHSFPDNGLNRLAILADLDLEQGRSEVVVAHILVPHPPLLADESCQINYSEDLDGMNVGAPYFTRPTQLARRQAYLAQLTCTNQKVLEALSNPSFMDAIVVILGDHGTDAQGQLLTPVSEWTGGMIAERMGTLVAVRGCGANPSNATINVLRWVSNCAYGKHRPMLDLRQFLLPVTENHPMDSVIEVSRE